MLISLNSRDVHRSSYYAFDYRTIYPARRIMPYSRCRMTAVPLPLSVW